MIRSFRNISFIGSGAIATALGNTLAQNEELDITLVSIEEDVVEWINSDHVNRKYFPSIPLRPMLKATTDVTSLRTAEVIFLAIPSTQIVKFIENTSDNIPENAILVNLAKGFGENNKTIIESLGELIPNPLVTLKGPSFARDIVNDQPTGFTLATEHTDLFPMFHDMFEETEFHLDYSTDIKGVEILSILKNIYAIVMGIVDAHFDSANLRFMVLTRAFNEMREILDAFEGNERTMFKYCGYGDFSLTALNDLSRNRTLGLLIGKSFFVKDISDKVILEGKMAVNVFYDELSKKGPMTKYPIIHELYKVFSNSYDITKFTERILNGEEE
jgi:glycerol-3-phosphate dehydrogenase (NAD(P)+)